MNRKRLALLPVLLLTAVTLAACSGHTDTASSVTDATATLNAHGSCDKTCAAWMRYRPVGSTAWTETTHFQVPNPVTNAPWSVQVTGLTSARQYEYQACGRENSWTDPNQYVCVGPDGSPSTTTSFTTMDTAIVSMGDSYISGEAGRWQGNSDDVAGSRDGTDRACSPSISDCTSYDESKVYIDGSDVNKCHRSDVAEIMSAAIPVQNKINLACSGAVTANIFRASNGGQSQDGLPPQADQLASVANAHRVKLIQLAIGGNDLGFASIVQACLTAYESSTGPCEPSQQANLDANFPAMAAGVAKSIDEIRAVMRNDGYADGDYRIVVQSYPSVIPRGSENRYLELDRASRTGIGGCPFYDSDSTWARDSVVPQIADHLRYVAAIKGVQFLDLRNALQGREICSKSDSLATVTNPPSATTSEWGRIVNQSTITEGELQEAFHPNAYAQQAFGRCVTLMYAQPTGDWECDNTPGQDFNGMTLKGPL